MIGFLRFVGMLNAAIWLGAAVFFAVGAGPALGSPEALRALRAEYFGYISGAMTQVVLTRYLHWHIVCSLIALLHLLAEWLYLGRAAHRAWLALLGGLLGVGLLGSVWLEPKIRELHRTQHTLNLQPAVREAAAGRFRFWHGVFQFVNVVVIAGVAVYFWRTTNPSEPLRFVSPAKFRG